MYKAAILTISTKGAKGERVDESGPALKKILIEEGFDVRYTNIITDDRVAIKNELNKLCDENINLILTTGGTGFSKTDVTPEATSDVIEKLAPGISEIMRLKSYEETKKSVLSRGISGIKNNSLIINLPGSTKGATESFNIVKNVIKHGIEIMLTNGSSDCGNK